jgi:hypothetical protein
MLGSPKMKLTALSSSWKSPGSSSRCSLVLISPGRVVPPGARPGGSRTTRPVAVIAAGSLGVFILGHTIGERVALPGGVVRILVPRVLAIQEPIRSAWLRVERN